MLSQQMSPWFTTSFASSAKKKTVEASHSTLESFSGHAGWSWRSSCNGEDLADSSKNAKMEISQNILLSRVFYLKCLLWAYISNRMKWWNENCTWQWISKNWHIWLCGIVAHKRRPAKRSKPLVIVKKNMVPGPKDFKMKVMTKITFL